jgi:hypothetical protein
MSYGYAVQSSQCTAHAMGLKAPKYREDVWFHSFRKEEKRMRNTVPSVRASVSIHQWPSPEGERELWMEVEMEKPGLIFHWARAAGLELWKTAALPANGAGPVCPRFRPRRLNEQRNASYPHSWNRALIHSPNRNVNEKPHRTVFRWILHIRGTVHGQVVSIYMLLFLFSLW